MITYRLETEEDRQAIFAVEEAAFTDHPHGEGTEPLIVEQLRRDDDLILSLVAEDSETGEIVGHVAISPARLSDGSPGWLGLGPIAVIPSRQGQGIGSKLMEEACGRCRDLGAEGVMLVGDVGFYSRFGFVQDTPITMLGALNAYLQVLPFTDDIPEAVVKFAPAFVFARPKNR